MAGDGFRELVRLRWAIDTLEHHSQKSPVKKQGFDVSDLERDK